jgi:serine/arginine repetitive matrix protein 2
MLRSIVNGLREDDVEEVYDSRQSFASDFSSEQSAEGAQLFFKEHTRQASKGSNHSFLTRMYKKPRSPTTGHFRPETKVRAPACSHGQHAADASQVFHSSAEQIARLIENMSRGMDSGSFNIMPNAPALPRAARGHAPSHSAGSSSVGGSESHWTVEERLDRMLGSMSST